MTSVYDGGPGFHPERLWQPNALIVGEDRVAVDHTAWQMIERKRAEAGMPTLEAAGRPPRYIATAADAAHQSGRQRSAAHSPDGRFDREDDHGRGNRTQAGREAARRRMTRREAMLQLLRVGGVAAGAAGAGVWLSEHSFRPVPARAEQARRDHRISPPHSA